MIRKLLLAACALMMPFPALSQTGFENAVQAEVLSGWLRDDGSRMAALQLTLAPGWKTYWRAPGDAGIPPKFDWSRSRNLAAISTTWPTPDVFHENGMRSIGYTETLTIPLTIRPRQADRPIRLRARMELGICSDICLPHTLEFDAMLHDESRTPVPAIAAALADQPYSAAEAGVSKTTCRVEPTRDGIRLEARIAMPSAGGQEAAAIETGLGQIWVSEPETRRDGNTLIASSEMIHVDGKPFALDRSAIRITVFGAHHAVDIRGCSAS